MFPLETHGLTNISQEKQSLIEAGDEEGAKKLEEKAAAEAEQAELDMDNLDVSWLKIEIPVFFCHGDQFFFFFFPDKNTWNKAGEYGLLGSCWKQKVTVPLDRSKLKTPSWDEHKEWCRMSTGIQQQCWYFVA